MNERREPFPFLSPSMFVFNAVRDALAFTGLAIFCYSIVQLFLNRNPTTIDRTTILLFSTTDWFDMTCAAAYQAERFSRALDEVQVIVPTREGNLVIRTDSWTALGVLSNNRSLASEYEFLYRRLHYAATMAKLRSRDSGGLFMLDSDTALFRNVVGRILRNQSIVRYDFVFQRELPCRTERGRWCINAGVWWMDTGSLHARAALSSALQLMYKLRLPDQDALQHALAADRTLRIAFLDVSRHPNGFIYNVDSHLQTDELHLVHVNWAPSKQAKLERLYDLGVIEKYSRCFSAETLFSLRSNNSAVMTNARRRSGGLLKPLTLPTMAMADVTNALNCERANDAKQCIGERGEAYVISGLRDARS